MGNKFSRITFVLFTVFGLLTLNLSELKAGKINLAPAGMVKIPAGRYTSFLVDKETGQQTIKAFYLDMKSVSNAEFLEFVKRNPKWSKSRVSKLYADASYLKHWKSDFIVGDSYNKIKDSPVTNVSWHVANAYAKWKGKRLPTLSEWEYAGNSPFLNDKRPVEKVILDWYSKPTPAVLPAASAAYKNKLNVYGMHGLIWEWVYDFNSIIMADDSRSNLAINRDLFCASGALGAIDKENYAAYMRYAYRGSLKANYTVNNLGFRCARDIN
jgi:formylglycine-generating enzyme